MNSSPSPSPHPDQTADSAAPSGAEKPTFSQSDMPTGAGADQSIPTVAAAVDVGATLSGYKLIQKLGEGGMGAVFIAEDVALRRKVALKTMKPELAAKAASKQRFMREARAAARIEHDNIVPIFQVGEDKGVPFLAMALLKGESLGDHLKRDPRPDVPFMLKVGRDVAAGLAAAHKQGLVHRDIKPDNIWIEPLPEGDGIRAKILDFGLARPQAEEESLVTQEGAILGTPAYMSPEQARGLPVDSRADLFSLGVVFYQMAAGKRPFSGRDTMAILTSLALDTPDEPLSLNPELPPIFSRLIMRLLEKDAEKRVQKASDVVDVLKRLQPEATVVVVAQPKPIVEANPWEDIDASMTDVEPQPPPPPLAASRPQPVKPIHRDQTEVVHHDAASGKSRSKKPLLIGGAVALAGIIVAAVLIFGNKKSDPPADTKNQHVKKEEAPKRKAPPTVIPVPPAEGNHALVLDGKKIALPVSLDVSRPFTVEAYLTKSAANSYPILVLNKFNLVSGTNWTFKLNGQKVLSNVISTRANDSKRHHLACVFNGKEMHLFVNGSKMATKNIEDDLPKQAVGPFELSHGYKGQIDEIRISQSARYERDFTPQARFETDKDTLALYHCDEGHGEELKDSSGNNYHGTIVGAMWVKVDGTPAPTRSNFALAFDGKASAVSVAGIPIAPGQPLTIEARVKRRSVVNVAEIQTIAGWQFLLIRQGKKHGFLFRNGPGETAGLTMEDVQAGVETHLALCYDGMQTLRFFVDGKKQNPVKLIEPFSDNVLANAEFFLGARARPKGDPFDRIFDGEIDEIRISKIVRYEASFTPKLRFDTDNDTLALYHCDEGQGDVLKDSSGNGHDGKIVGAKWVKAGLTTGPPPSTIALEFDGKSYVELPDLKVGPGQTVTIEARMHPGDPPKDKGSQAIAGWRFLALNRTWKYGSVFVQKGNNQHVGLVAIEERPGVETHMAVCYDGNQALRLFVDGKLEKGTKVKEGLSENPRDYAAFVIGALPMGNPQPYVTFFKGQIAEVRISKSARYDKDYTPLRRFTTDADTLALYHCDEGEGDVLKDSSGNNHHGKIVGAKWVKVEGAPLGALPAKFKNALGMEFALIPKGKSWLGGDGGKPGTKEVEFKEDFYLGVYEVTQEEWQRMTGKNPGYFMHGAPGKNSVKDIAEADLKRFPVEFITWDDAQAFIKLLNEKAPDAGWVYRLPTEAQWEYACRGGPMTDMAESAFSYYLAKPTNDLLPDQANFKRDGLNRTCKVGSYAPNRLGLYDMHGNVREWCDDVEDDGKGLSRRAARGGGQDNLPGTTTAISRILFTPDTARSGTGLRVARVPVNPTPP